jgi:hypothetical protein
MVVTAVVATFITVVAVVVAMVLVAPGPYIAGQIRRGCFALCST